MSAAQGVRALTGVVVLLQVLYKRVCEYLELDTRVEVLNARWVLWASCDPVSSSRAAIGFSAAQCNLPLN